MAVVTCLWAAVIYIDDLAEGSFDLTVDSGSPIDSASNLGLPQDRVIGGRRDSYLAYLSGSSSINANDVDYPSALFYAANPGCEGWLRLQYGVASSMNTDLTFGGVNDGIYFEYGFSDLGGTCEVTVNSSAGSATVAKALPVMLLAGTEMMSFSFSEFSGVDFADVDSITVLWTNMTVGADFTVSFLAAAQGEDFLIPEPAVLGLFFLGGLMLIRRRRGCS